MQMMDMGFPVYVSSIFQLCLTHRNRKIVTLHNRNLNSSTFSWTLVPPEAPQVSAAWCQGYDMANDSDGRCWCFRKEKCSATISRYFKIPCCQSFHRLSVRNAWLGLGLHLSWSPVWPKLYAMAKLETMRNWYSISEAIDQTGSGL